MRRGWGQLKITISSGIALGEYFIQGAFFIFGSLVGDLLEELVVVQDKALQNLLADLLTGACYPGWCLTGWW
jgi:hypothetical protein